MAKFSQKRSMLNLLWISICDMGYENRESREESLPNFENRKLCKYVLLILEGWKSC